MNSSKVLVVDDTLHIRTLVRRFLEKYGFEVIEAGNGVEGLMAIQLNPDIKLVFLDHMMPKMNGPEFLARIFPVKESMDLKVCAMTAKETSADVRNFLKSGADDYIVKPIDESILVDKAKILVGEKDVNDFCTVKISSKSTIEHPDGKIDVCATRISENSLFFTSKFQFPVGSKLILNSPEIQEILKTRQQQILRLYSSERKGNEFENAASFVGLKDIDYKLLRAVTTRGE